MSELEEVSFWPGSSDGSYSRVGPTNSAMVTCRRRTVLIIAAVVAVIFIISVSIPAGMLTHYKKVDEASGADKSQVTTTAATTVSPSGNVTTTPATTPAPTTTTTATTTTTTAPPRPDFPVWGQYRLPTTVKPRIYNVSIDLKLFGTEREIERAIAYNGTVLIVLNVTEATDLIVLHASQMNLSSVKVAECEEGQDECSDFKSVKSFKMTNDSLQQVEIKMKKQYPVNTTLNLEIKFNTTLNDELHGFYKSSYNASDDMKRVIATTQFESVYARKAFPCFDEPSFKAKFALVITRPKDWTSLFNTELEYTADTGDSQRKTDYYGLSPEMSSYLVAFVVSDFGHTDTRDINSTNGNNISITVYGQQKQVPQLTYALDVTAKVISIYEEFFQIPYPLPKLDIVAIPDFAAGAMENWGLITFRETALLYDSSSTSSATQQYIAYVIAHELAHQWFGNLVTMQWWNELWLNEGFATFVGKLIGTATLNTMEDTNWPIEEDFRVDVATSLDLDSLLTSHALSQNAENVSSAADIEAMFDSITYSKGSAIINMLYNYVTPEVAQTALQKYLTKYAYDNAVASDLWSAFDKAYFAANLTTNKKAITEMMKSWTDTSGHPYITANIADNKLQLNQSQFYLGNTSGNDSSLWHVPILYDTYGSKPLANRSHVLKGVSDEVNTPGTDWALLNKGWIGYYHVKYVDKVNISLVMTDIDLGNAVNDMFMLFRGNQTLSEEFIHFIDGAAKSDVAGYLTWRMLLRCYSYLLNVFDHQFHNYENIGGQVILWLDLTGENVTYDAVDSLSVRQRTLLASKIDMALAIDHEFVRQNVTGMSELADLWVQSRYSDTIKTSGRIHPDIARQVWKCGYQTNESSFLWEDLWIAFQESHIPSEQKNYMAVLASGIDNALLNHYLDYSLEKARKSDTVSIIQLVASNRRCRYDAWDFVKSNWNALIASHGDAGFAMNSLIKSTTNYFSDAYKLADMQYFFDNNELASGERASKQSLEIVQANIYMMNITSRSLLNTILGLTKE